MTRKNVWTESTIVYHIYVRSFGDSNNDGIGDLNGIIGKLNYLNDDTDNSLGVDAIWLSPIYTSPQVDFGYDVSDYQNVDPIFGSLDDFKRLLFEAHQRGIKVMMDFVPNHTSDQHSWFLKSKSSKNNDKRDYYIWKDPKDGGVPNNWLSVFGGSAWEFDEKTSQYYLHSFDKAQPDLNWRNPEVEKEMYEALRFWLRLGVDGFRVDAPEWMFKDPYFGDEEENPQFLSGADHDPYHALIHTKTYALPESFLILKKFVRVLEEFPNKFMVSEIWSDMSQLLKMYRIVDKKHFSPFNFNFMTLPWKANIFKKFIDEYNGAVGTLYHPNYVLGNHDRPRVASRIGQDQARIAAMLTLSLRGLPYIYYGEEIGMENTLIPPDKIQDPFEKSSPGLGLGRDPQRTPMQWDNSKFAGFSKSQPWLPVNENYFERNVKAQQQDDRSMLSLYRKLIDVRQNSLALQKGKYISFTPDNEEVFVFLRILGKEMMLILLNYSNQEQKINLPFSKGVIVIDTQLKKTNKRISLTSLSLESNEGLIVKL
jgi:alpha-glucosidase